MVLILFALEGILMLLAFYLGAKVAFNFRWLSQKIDIPEEDSVDEIAEDQNIELFPEE